MGVIFNSFLYWFLLVLFHCAIFQHGFGQDITESPGKIQNLNNNDKISFGSLANGTLQLTEFNDSFEEKPTKVETTGEEVDFLELEKVTSDILSSSKLNVASEALLENGIKEKIEVKTFNEWAEEQRKRVQNLTYIDNNSVPVDLKMDENFASSSCGAKVIDSNPETEYASNILNGNTDEYLLGKCNVKTWFIIQLCEPCQISKVELANFELYSSLPRAFSVYVNDRYPLNAEKWIKLGSYEAQDVKHLQSFNAHHKNLFGKYIKVEILSHWGNNYFCPLSLFRVFGFSEYQVLQNDFANEPVLSLISDTNLGQKSDKVLSFNNDSQHNENAARMNIPYKQEVCHKIANECKFIKVSTLSLAKSSIFENCIASPGHTIMNITTINSWINCHFDYFQEIKKSALVTKVVDFPFCSAIGWTAFSSRVKSKVSAHSQFLIATVSIEALHALCYLKTLELTLQTRNVSGTSTKSYYFDNTGTDDFLEPFVSDINLVTSSSKQESDIHLSATMPIQSIRPITTGTVPLPVDSPLSLKDTLPNNEIISSPTVESSSLQGVSTGTLASSLNNENITEQFNLTKNCVNGTSLHGTDNPTLVNETSTPQGEPQILKLSNRIKKLEVDTILFSEYLDKLSREYNVRKEEMQKTRKSVNAVLTTANRIQNDFRNLEKALDALMKTAEELSTPTSLNQVQVILFHVFTTICISIGLGCYFYYQRNVRNSNYR